MSEITKAITQVMLAVKYLQKDNTVGSGSYSYKAITDEKVRLAVREEMANNGLAMRPIDIDNDVKIDRWTNQNGHQKQQITIFSTITYEITHTSGESLQMVSMGVGIDSADKSPGKAMTYAYKNALLNLFCIPTGNDPDQTHSDEIENPPLNPTPPETPPKTPTNKIKNISTQKDFNTLLKWIEEDPEQRKIKALASYTFSKDEWRDKITGL